MKQLSLPDAIPENVMEKAFFASDAEFDGLFYTAVKTTGIFCKPSCRARKPLRQNVAFFRSVGEAMDSGFRACKKCQPLESGQAPAWLAGILAHLRDQPHERIRDSELGRFGAEPATVRRYFQKHYGMTFQHFCRATRLGKAFEHLREGASLDAAALDHGYESLSGFRDAFAHILGGTAGKAEGRDIVRLVWIESPVGPLIAGATDRGVCLLEFTTRRMLEKQLQKLKRYFGGGFVPGRNAHLEKLERELRAYFAGKLRKFTVPLDYPGSDFQRKVWEGLLRIPYGETRSYGQLARAIGQAGAMRAVGTANGMNRIAIVIPCHRVIQESGALGGYGGGLWRKTVLLDLEKKNKDA